MVLLLDNSFSPGTSSKFFFLHANSNSNSDPKSSTPIRSKRKFATFRRSNSEGDSIRSSSTTIHNSSPLHRPISSLPRDHLTSHPALANQSASRVSGDRTVGLPLSAANLTMGQRWARQAVEQGVQLYHAQRHEEAIQKWCSALRRLKAPQERFIALGYLAQAYGETGHYRDMLVYALHQIDLANEKDDSYMRAEAYLNLARSNEKLAEYHKAISYGRHCLQNQSEDPRTPGYAHLCIGTAFLGFSNFSRSLESFELAMQVAHEAQDRLLELQICIGLGSLFSQLKDTGKAELFLDNAKELLETIRIQDVHAKYKSLVNYNLAYVLTLHGDHAAAKLLCEEALDLSMANSNKPSEARCLIRIGDIYRDTNDGEKCWQSYEKGYQLMLEMGDRYGQMLALASMARCAVRLKTGQLSQCECQAIELNRKCLDVAKSIGCKLGQLKCHGRLQELYASLSDEDNEESARVAVTQLVREMETFCNFCGQRYADRNQSLQALPCSHIFHETCLRQYVGTLVARTEVECPKCVKASTSGSATISHLPSTSNS